MAIINTEIAKAIDNIRMPFIKNTGMFGESTLSTQEQEARASRSMKFLLAVSGGPDSQVLLKAFPHVCKEIGSLEYNAPIKCIAVGINHGLRAEADSELSLAEELASNIGVPFIRSKVHIEGSSNIQCKARDVRYERLYEIANEHQCDYVVTAHHFDDKAETVFMRLLRGEGMGSLAVMPELSGRIFRPLLHVTRADIMGYIKRWNLKFAIDPSNMNSHYLRSRIRHEIFPILEEINPCIKKRLVNLANEIGGHDGIRKWVSEELTRMVMKQ
jgi:tRNA(Ile)-lysidine synthase